MKCEGCGLEIGEADLTEHEGKLLCEDCCMDQLAPPKDCLHGGRVEGAWTRVEAEKRRAENGDG